MRDPREFFFELPETGRPAIFKLEEEVCADIAWFNANRASNRVFHSVAGVEGIVIHATAGASTAGALDWWKDPQGAAASAHWIVPDEDEAGHGKSVLAVVYESLAAWHVRNDRTHPKLGNRHKINHWTLGVEIVNSQSASDPYSDWQIEATAGIVRYCWAKYPNLKYVFSHAFVDPGRRSDPGSQFDWEGFKSLVVTPDGEGNRCEQSILSKILPLRDTVRGVGRRRSCCM